MRLPVPFKMLAATLLFSSLGTLQAQVAEIESGLIIHDNAPRPCLLVSLDPEPRTLKEAWKDYLNDQYDFKLKGIGFLSNKDLLSAEEVVIQQISSKALDFYTHIVGDENGSEMKVFAAFGYDIYIDKDKNPSEYNSLKGILENFLKEYLPKYYQAQIKETEDRIKDLMKERKKMKRDIDKKSEDIEDLKREIEELTRETNSNKEKLEVTEKSLEKRKEKLIRVKNALEEL